MRLGIVGEVLLEHPELEGERDEPLLRAVVEVALEPFSLLLTGREDARTRAVELVEPGAELGLEPRVLERDPGRGGRRGEQLGLVVERGVVDQGRDALAVVVDQRRRAAVRVRDLDRMSVKVGVAFEVGEPVGKGERRVAERPGQRTLECSGRRILGQLDHQVADRGARQPLPHEADEEGDRRDADHREHDPYDCFGRGPASERPDQDPDGDEDERDHERVDEQLT